MSSTSRRVTLPSAQEKSARVSRFLLRVVGLAAIFAGIVTLSGEWPMHSRTMKIAVGAGCVLAGLLLMVASNRRRRAPTEVA
jgi:uncharacterized protein YjeT (DUF2065 family)